jgi:hypothetical protein
MVELLGRITSHVDSVVDVEEIIEAGDHVVVLELRRPRLARRSPRADACSGRCFTPGPTPRRPRH